MVEGANETQPLGPGVTLPCPPPCSQQVAFLVGEGSLSSCLAGVSTVASQSVLCGVRRSLVAALRSSPVRVPEVREAVSWALQE